MKILIFGASGKLGSVIVRECINRGHTVSVFTHTSTGNFPDNVTPIHGDVYDQTSVTKAVHDQDVIISALGSWGTKQKNVVATGIAAIVEAHNGVSKRVVSVTGSAALAPGDQPGIIAKLGRALFMSVQPKILRDGEKSITLLADSSLDWHVIKSPVMTNSKSSDYRLSSKSGSPSISRRAVASAMVDLAEGLNCDSRALFIRQM